MLIRPSFKKSLIVEQFQGNYLNKNPNLREADQLAIYKHDQGVELGSAQWSEQDLNPKPPDFKGLQDRRSNNIAM